MEKKNKNGIAITLMGVIIILLLVLCVLFATKQIDLFESNVNKKSSTETSKNNNLNKKNDLNIEEINAVAKELGEKMYINLTSFNSSWIFCGENMEWNNESDYIPFEEESMSYIHKYDVSKDFKSINELNEYFNSFMTEEIINKYYRKDSEIYEFKDGKYVNDIYLEKDGKLYCRNFNKDHGYVVYDDKNSNYRVIEYDDHTITAIANIGYFEKGYNMANETGIVLYSLKKEKSNWLISSFSYLPQGNVNLSIVDTYLNNIVDYNKENPNHKISIVYNDYDYTNDTDILNISQNIESGLKSPNGEKWINFQAIYNNKGYVSKIALN